MNNKTCDKIVAQGFGFDATDSLRAQLKKQEDWAIDEWTENADRKIERIKTCLIEPIDSPEWPKPKYVGETTDEIRSHEAVLKTASALDSGLGDEFVEISRNYENSRRHFNFRILYAGAAVIGVGLFVLAMAVDYSIINEFWKRALANEFLEVPDALGNSILFKSLQVVIAAVAFHFFLSTLKDKSRKTFVTSVFILTLFMAAGFGILVNRQAMPDDQVRMLTGSESVLPADEVEGGLTVFDEFDISETQSVQRTTRASVLPPEVMNFLYDTSWMIAPAIVFLIATAVGALSLQLAESNIKNFVKAGDFTSRRTQMRELDTLMDGRDWLQTANEGQRTSGKSKTPFVGRVA